MRTHWKPEPNSHQWHWRQTLGHKMLFSLGTKFPTQNHILAKRSGFPLTAISTGRWGCKPSGHRASSLQPKPQTLVLWCATNSIHLSALSKISFYSLMEKAINIQTKESHFKNPIHKKQPPRTFKQQSGGKNVSIAQFSSKYARESNPIHCYNS